MELVVKENFILEERRISLSEFHTADEVLSAYKLSAFWGQIELSVPLSSLEKSESGFVFSGMDNRNYGRTKPGMYTL